MGKELERQAGDLYDLLIKEKRTIAVAESCTGGFISYCITMIPGASRIFRGGVVAYSADLKRGLLGVDAGLIKDKGVVSPDVALAMAEQVRVRSGADFSVAVTGNLGPDVLEGKGKGLVYLAASAEDRSTSGILRLGGSREENREEAALAAMRLLADLIMRNK